jgi:hypothetical protein
VTVSNNGNVGLGGLTLLASANGYGLTCVDTSVLDAGASRACTLTRSVNQVNKNLVFMPGLAKETFSWRKEGGGWQATSHWLATQQLGSSPYVGSGMAARQVVMFEPLVRSKRAHKCLVPATPAAVQPNVCDVPHCLDCWVTPQWHWHSLRRKELAGQACLHTICLPHCCCRTTLMLAPLRCLQQSSQQLQSAAVVLPHLRPTSSLQASARLLNCLCKLLTHRHKSPQEVSVRLQYAVLTLQCRSAEIARPAADSLLTPLAGDVSSRGGIY